MSLKMKAAYNIVEGGIFLEGFLNVVEDYQFYDWKNYFFMEELHEHIV